MSYKALYRTYRPKQFKDVLGQEHIVQTLTNIISENKVGHAYLFAGPRGTGKTSVAHIFARALNCTETVFFEKPCNKCEQCLLSKNNMDIIEIDAASNNGVAEIRTLIENSKYAPSNSQYKVYIIDEVHMLSKGAWNALLKTLEEPPKHVVFIMATTEPHKIPITILSRTQRFNFKRIEDKYIIANIKKVLKEEKIQHDSDTLKLIARLADGGMRDAISMVDQASAYGNNKISVEILTKIFGVVSKENQIDLINLVFTKQINKMLTLLSSLVENGIDIERLVVSLIDILKDFLIYEKTKSSKLLTILNQFEVRHIHLSPMFAFNAIDILSETFTKLKFSEMPRQLMEVALLKIAEKSNGNRVMRRIEEDERELKIIESKEEQIEMEQIEKLSDKKNDDELDLIDGMKIPKTSPEELAVIKEEVKKETEATQLFSIDELNKIEEKDVVESLREIVKEIDKTGSDEKIEKQDVKKEDVESLIKDSTISQEIKITSHNNEEVGETDDLMDMFNFEEDTSNNKIQEAYSLDQIINLLIQSNKQSNQTIKQQWDYILTFINKPDYKEYVLLLKDTKLIASGDNFILIGHENDKIINDIKKLNQNNSFLSLVRDWLGSAKNVYAITKKGFEEVKVAYKKMATSGMLPEPTPIDIPHIIVKKEEISENEDEQFGKDFFGELFDS